MPATRGSAPRKPNVGVLATELAKLIAESKDLRDVLVRNERAAAKLLRHLERTGSVQTAMEALEGSMRGPRELPDALSDFEATRRRTRYILFAVAQSQELSMSELARRFGVSRQLVSRVMAEAGVGSKARTGSRRPASGG